ALLDVVALACEDVQQRERDAEHREHGQPDDERLTCRAGQRESEGNGGHRRPTTFRANASWRKSSGSRAMPWSVSRSENCGRMPVLVRCPTLRPSPSTPIP